MRLLNELGFRLTGSRPRFGPVTSLNEFFDRIAFLNLDRRPDRLRDMEVQQSGLNFTAHRQPAVDGSRADVMERFDAYQAAHSKPKPQADLPPKLTDRILNHDTRITLEERDLGRASIQSAGAWAYMETQVEILEHAIETNVQHLLLLDDDVLFHKDFYTGFNASLAQLPKDWKILQLGTLRYSWGLRSTRYYTKGLLHQGRSIGSHAVGLSAAVLPELLELVRKMDAPFDIGALSTLACRHKARSFVCIPQLCIQSFADTDIQSPDKKHFTDPSEVFRSLHWDRENFWNIG